MTLQKESEAQFAHNALLFNQLHRIYFHAPLRYYLIYSLTSETTSMPRNRLLYAISLTPVLIIVLTMFSMLWQQRNAQPQYNFLYLTSETYRGSFCAMQLKAKLMPQQYKTTTPQDPCSDIKLYTYNFKTHKSTAVTYQQATQLPLLPSETSPDNFKIGPDYHMTLFWFWPMTNTNNNDLVLLKQQYKQSLTLDQPIDKTHRKISHFIAWINSSPSK